MKKRFNVLITRRLHRSALDELEKKCNVLLHAGKIPIPKKNLMNEIKNVDGLICHPYDNIDKEIMKNELKPKTISAIFLSLNNRTQIFQFQRDIINYKEEAISSVMPGITLSRLWMLTGNVDKAFKIITFFIIIIALLGMIAMTIAGLSSRRREMAILRSVGASPTNIVSLLLVESIIISVVSCIVGYILMVVIFSLGKDYLQNNYGIFIDSFSIKNYDLQIVITIVFAALIATIVPAIQIYKNTLRDGLSVKS